MSPLWPDKLRVTLRPGRVEVIRSSSGLRARILESATIPCNSEADSPLWEPPVAALKQYLAALPSKHEVTITLSSHFVQYARVPWSDALVNEEERLSLARICFEQIYGDMARSWSLRVSHAGYGQPSIASAIDQALLDGLQSACAGSKVRLTSLQPLLMTELNRFRKRFKSKDFMVLLVEPGRVCLLRGQHGTVEIKSAAIGENLSEALDMLMAREAIMHASQNHARPYLIASGYPRSAITEVSGKFEVLACDPSPGRGSNTLSTGMSA